MSRWLSRASASSDLDAYDADRFPEAVPEPIEDEPPTAPVAPLTVAQQLAFCMVCNAPSDGTCASCEAKRLEGRR